MNPLIDYGMTDTQYSYCVDLIEIEAKYKNYNIAEVHLGGSAARKSMQEHSDFDLFVYVKSGKVDNNYISVCCEGRMINIKLYEMPKKKTDLSLVSLGGKTYSLTTVDFYTGDTVSRPEDDAAFLDARRQYRHKSRWRKPWEDEDTQDKDQSPDGEVTESEVEVAYECDNV